MSIIVVNKDLIQITSGGVIYFEGLPAQVVMNFLINNKRIYVYSSSLGFVLFSTINKKGYVPIYSGNDFYTFSLERILRISYRNLPLQRSMEFDSKVLKLVPKIIKENLDWRVRLFCFPKSFEYNIMDFEGDQFYNLIFLIANKIFKVDIDFITEECMTTIVYKSSNRYEYLLNIFINYKIFKIWKHC